MNQQVKTGTVLVGVLLVLGGIAYWDERETEREAEQEKNKNKALVFSAETLSEIAYRHRPDKDDDSAKGLVDVRLVKEDGVWRIASPIEALADATTVSQLVERMGEFSYDRVVGDSKDRWAQYGLDDGMIRVDLKFTDAEGTQDQKFIVVGEKAPVGYSTYVRTSDSERVLLGSQSIRMSLAKSLFDFRQKNIATFDQAKLSKWRYSRPGKSAVEFSRQDGQFSLSVGGEELEADQGAIDRFLASFQGTQASEFFDQPQSDLVDLFKDPAKREATFEWTVEDGRSTVLMVARRADRLIAAYDPKVSIFELPSGSDSKLLKQSIDFRNREVFPFDPAKVTGMQVDGQRFHKQGEDWFPEGTTKASEGASHQGHLVSLISDLDAADAEAFFELGGTQDKGLAAAPQHKISLEFGGEGERLEISAWKKGGEGFYVRHSRGKYLYVVSPTTFGHVSAPRALEGDS